MRDHLEGLSQEQPPSWYLARDGQQFGPLSDAEMKVFNELGHLQRTDLVWRKGFSDWRRAGDVFDIRPRLRS
jgi:hypothetical protein